MLKIQPQDYKKKENKSVLFFSASSSRDWKHLIDFGVSEMLVSYHYIRKRRDYFEGEILPVIKERGGLFMTDSGAFSFMGAMMDKPEAKTVEFWKPYLEEYYEWLDKFKDDIFVAANLDLDLFLGRDQIDRWNDDYFKKLEKNMNMVYIAHRDWDNQYNDYTGLKRFKEYLKLHDYIGVNQKMKDYATTIASLAKIHNKRIHGFAWTSIPLLKKHPLFSADSVSWLAGTMWGTTYDYDGKNFRTYSKDQKYRRNANKVWLQKQGIDFEGVKEERSKEIDEMNLTAWLGARRDYMKIANLKLNNKNVSEYVKGR